MSADSVSNIPTQPPADSRNVPAASADAPAAAAVKASTIKEFRADVWRMVGYCRDQGTVIPDAVIEEVASIAQESAPAADRESFARLLRVHGQLSTLIAPATPRSLAATQLTRDPRAIKTFALLSFLILSAVVGLIGYVYTVSHLAPTKNPQPGPATAERSELHDQFLTSLDLQSGANRVSGTRSVSNSGVWNIQLNYLYAAMLGAAFNGLFTAYSYLKDRSFDPHYVVVYIIRFVVGLLAGVVLANLGSELFKDQDTLAKLGPGIIALLGGYSAEAVRQILDRLVEVLIAVVKGKDASAEQRLAVAKEVLSVSQAAAADPATPAEVRSKLEGLMKKLQQ